MSDEKVKELQELLEERAEKKLKGDIEVWKNNAFSCGGQNLRWEKVLIPVGSNDSQEQRSFGWMDLVCRVEDVIIKKFRPEYVKAEVAGFAEKVDRLQEQITELRDQIPQ